jgi:hypothetical protein
MEVHMTAFYKVISGLTLAIALGVIAAPGVAQADGWRDRGDYRRHGEHEGWRRGGVYYAPAPAYYAPPPVYYAPPPVYYAPPPVYAFPSVTLGIRLP